MILAVVDDRVIRVEVIGSLGHDVAKFLARLNAIGDAGVKDLWCNLRRTYITAKNCRDRVGHPRMTVPTLTFTFKISKQDGEQDAPAGGLMMLIVTAPLLVISTGAPNCPVLSCATAVW